MSNENLKAILSGAAAGAIGFTTTLPIDYFKQHMQTGESFSQTMKNVQIKGPNVLFRGGLIGLTSIAPQMAIKYLAFHNFNAMFDDKLMTKPLAAFGAGLMDGAFLGPILAFQAFKQMNIDNKKIDYSKIVKNNFKQLMVPMALRNATYTSGILGGYFLVKHSMCQDLNIHFGHNFLIGSALNLPATLLCSPFDVIRAKHTQKLLVCNGQKVSLTSVVRDIVVKDGFRGFYRGYSSLFLNFAIRFPLTLALQFEIIKYLHF